MKKAQQPDAGITWHFPDARAEREVEASGEEGDQDGFGGPFHAIDIVLERHGAPDLNAACATDSHLHWRHGVKRNISLIVDLAAGPAGPRFVDFCPALGMVCSRI